MKQSSQSFLALACAFSMAAHAGAATVNPGTGYTNDFGVQPPAVDWATVSVTGAAGDVYDMDTEVNLLIAGGITAQTTLNANNPATTSGTATWSSPGLYLQTRPTQNRFTVLMGTFVNNTGTNATQITLSYLFTTAGAANAEEAGKGTRAYFSLTGFAGSWVNLPALNNTSAVLASGTVSTNLPLAWPAGASLYLLWADDNANPGTDMADQIDDFSLVVSAGSPPITGLACFLTAPTNRAVFVTGTPITAAASILNGAPPFDVGFWTNRGVGNTVFRSAGSSSTEPYERNLGQPAPGTYNVFATATDDNGGAANSVTNTFVVADLITFTLTAPAHNATFDTSVSVMGTTTILGGTAPYSVQFYLDNAPSGAPVTSVPFERNFGPLFVGDHTIRATVTDASGWVSNSLVSTVHITGPVGATLTPTNGAIFNFGQSVTLSADVAGGVVPYTAAFFVNDQPAGSLSAPPFATSLGVLAVGSYTSYVHVTDSSVPTPQQNNSGTNVFTIAPNPLLATLTNPTNGQSATAGPAFILRATATVLGPVTVNRVEFFYDGLSAGVDTNAPFAVTLAGPTEGLHAVYAVATDSLGRTSYTVTNQVAFVVDPLANNNFANRFTLGTPASATGNNTGANTEGGEPTFQFGGGLPLIQWGATLWYKWTAPFNGAVTIDTLGSGVNTVLSVYTGAAVNALTLVQRNDNAPGQASASLVSFAATAGTEYQIQVGGVGGGGAAAQGPFQLNLALPPFVAITNPPAGATFLAGGSIAVNAIAAPTAAAVTNVSLYRGATLLGSADVPPYSFLVSNAPLGTNAFYAVARDAIGQVGTSAVVRVLVANVGITITSPQEDSVLTGTNPITIAVFAIVPGGLITNVDFFLDGAPLGQAAGAPFTATWSNVVGGSHRVTATGRDNLGNSYAATPVNFGVASGLVRSNSSWKYLADGSDQGTNWIAPLFNDTGWSNGLAEMGYGDGDEATVVSSGPAGAFYITTYFRRSFEATNIAGLAGLILSVEYDDAAAVYLNGREIFRTANLPADAGYATVATGAAIEDTLSVTVLNPTNLIEGVNVLAVEVHQQAPNSSDISFNLDLQGVPIIIHNVSPAVAITNLAGGQFFLAPPSVTIAAGASDPDGSVAKVEFFADGVKLGETTNAPYSFAWNDPPIGAHSLTAVATDNQGATAASTPVPIVVYDAAGTPVTQITSPLNGAIMEGPTNLILTATANAINGVTNVQFLANGVEIANDPAPPYSVVWPSTFLSNGLMTIVSDANGVRGTSALVSVTITIPPTNLIAPTIVTQMPPAFSIVTSLTNITIRFSEPVQNVDATDLLVNGFPATGLSGSGSNYTFSFPPQPYGEVEIAFATDHGITDYGFPSSLPFDELGADAAWEYDYVDAVPPTVLSHLPLTGVTVTNLTNIVVNFSEPVTGVDAADLLVNGTPAFAVGGGGASYAFSVLQPASGTITITWATNHGIADQAMGVPPNAFNRTGPGATWSFTLDSRTIFVQTNSTWKYIKGLAEASSPTNAWRQFSFDDSTWTNSLAPFLFGEPAFTNALNPGTDLGDMTNNAYSSIYLRQRFVVPNAGAVTNLLLRHQSDDGFIAWINGVEVLRYNMPAGTIPYNGSASAQAAETGGTGGVPPIMATLTNAVAALVSGTNILAVHAFNVVSTPASSDFVFNAQLYTFLSDAAFAPPRLVQAVPAQGDVFFLTNITVTFSEGVTNVDAGDLLVNGTAATGVSSTTNTIHTFSFAQPLYGPVTVTWANGHGITDLDDVPKPFDGTASGSILHYTLVNPSAPTVASQSPAASLTVTGLTSIVVTFSEPVAGVDATDLLVNNAPAAGISSAVNTTYTFTFPQPPFGPVAIRWAADHGIRDLEMPANDFDRDRPANQWNYALVNPVPSAALTSPTNGAFLLAGTDLTLRATAADNDGTIALLEFFEGANKLGEATNAPYSTVWPVVPLGAYTLRAVATDNIGLRGTSAPVFINVVAVLPVALTRGPYLQMGSPTGGVVRWRTDAASDSVVYYGTEAASLTNVVLVPAPTNEHIVFLGGLQPGTRYFYAIGSSVQTLAGGTNVAGSNFWFNTSPVPGARQSVRFWALGDSGTANANARAVRDAFYNFATTNNRPPDLWLMLGDNAYNSGTDAEHQAAVFDMYPATLRNRFLWPTIGNHETAQSTTATSFPYLNIFSLPQNGEAGGVPSGTKKYYSFDYANIHFVCLDSMTSGRTSTSPMAQWLRDDLAATLQEWIIVFFHHPPYTKGSHNSDAEGDLIDIRANLVPILETNGVDLVLSGHSHCFERSFLLNGHYGLSGTLTPAMKIDGGDGREDGAGAYQKNALDQGVVYTVAGSSGQISGGQLNHPAHFISLNELGSLVIDVNSNRLDAMFLNSTGVSRDHYTIIKPNKAPLALDGLLALDEDSASPITLAASDPEGAPLSYTVITAPAHGTAHFVDTNGAVVLVAGGVSLGPVTGLIYTPDTNFHGMDSLTFKVSDGSLDSGLGTISITVAPVNDAPVADAGATPLRSFISPNNLNAVAVLDGSLSSDVDGDPLQFFWHDGATLISTGMISVVTLPIGLHTILLEVSDGQASGTNAIAIEVLTAGQTAQRLIDLINATALLRKNSRPLIATLEAARDAFNRGHGGPGINQLQAFQNKVRAQIEPGDPALAADLLRSAQTIIDALGGPRARPKLAVAAQRGARGVQISFAGDADRAYVIEASPDMIHWQRVGTAKHHGNGRFQFDDNTTNRNAPCRFYRVQAP